jgi:hypothetical protein
MPKKSEVKKDWTTLIVQKNTRDMINKIAKGRNMTQDEVVMDLINSNTPIYIEPEKQAIIGDVADFLVKTKCIKQPDLNSVVDFALNNLIEGVTKSVQGR